jgi:hypothetical protein
MRIASGILLVFLSSVLQAAEVKVVGDQMILSGRAAGNELALVRDVIAEHGDKITTVVLRDFSGRTEIDQLRWITEKFMERGWRTAVSGFCGTACAYLFMGGVQRHFTDDKSPGQTEVMFGSTTWAIDSQRVGAHFKSAANANGNYQARAWIKTRSGDKISDALLDQLYVPDNSVRYLHFFDHTRLKRADGASILLCDGNEAPADRWKVCEKVASTDAYREGIITSTELIRSNDRPAK